MGRELLTLVGVVEVRCSNLLSEGEEPSRLGSERGE